MEADTRFVPPLKATLGALPPDDGTWATEIKWDGMRLQVHTGGTSPLRLFSATGRPVTSSFPELAPLSEALGAHAALDGEVVVMADGRPSFAHLQERIHLTAPGADLVDRVPVFYMVFDLLGLDGRSLLPLPYDDRRRLLVDLIEDGPSWRVPKASHENPRALFELAEARGLEGVVCKRRSAPYRPGSRSPDWVKVKVRAQQEFLVIGWLPSKSAEGLAEPRAERDLGSLLLAVHDGDGQLTFCGAVGSGLTDTHRRHLAASLRPTAAPPIEVVGRHTVPTPSSATAHWVEPETVVEVEFSLWPDGGLLWHPVFRGLRTDRDPGEVRRDAPPNPSGNEATARPEA